MLVGCGKMGQAMLAGWLENGVLANNIVIIEPGPAASSLQTETGCQVHSSLDEVDSGFNPDVVVLAIKPQMMDAVAPQYLSYMKGGAVLLSIAAGTTMTYFADIYGTDAAIVRAMPNTPAAIGRGMLVGYANTNVSEKQRDICHFLLQAVGKVAWIDDEKYMDAVTGVSGSGPAYVFYMIECMTVAGIDAGLPEDLALQLAETTVAGAAELARQSKESAAVLRQNVTSPNGTTAAGLEVLMAENGLKPLMSKTIAAATNRSRELG
jgi:pyrroline-5-carboxylate reductase